MRFCSTNQKSRRNFFIITIVILHHFCLPYLLLSVVFNFSLLVGNLEQIYQFIYPIWVFTVFYLDLSFFYNSPKKHVKIRGQNETKNHCGLKNFFRSNN